MNKTHPESLKIFFATELWERYGFYAVQSLLALFLISKFHWQDKAIYELVGSFTALTYLSPILGGYIADNYLGQRKSILLGGIILTIAYALLAFIHSSSNLTSVLSLIAIGTGLLKPNISALLGNQYPSDSLMRERGFMIFYIGITTGIILGTTIPSYLEYHYNWMYVYLSSAIGLLIGSLVFFFGMNRFKITDYQNNSFNIYKLIITIFLLLISTLTAKQLLTHSEVADMIFSITFISTALYIIYISKKQSLHQSRRTIALGLLCLISILFWTFYFQMFMSITLFIKRAVSPTLLSIYFPPPLYVTIQSIGMIIIGYFLRSSLSELSITQRGILSAYKFTIAIFCILTAYISILASIALYHEQTFIPSLVIVPIFLLISIAELMLSPVGLSVITLLSDKSNISTMMGIFFISLGIGAFLSGKLATFTALPSNINSIIEIKQIYYNGFWVLTSILFVGTLLTLCLYKMIKKLLQHE